MLVIWKVALHEYWTNLRRPGFIFVTLLLPGLGVLTLVITLFFSGQASRLIVSQMIPESKKTGIVDESHLFTPIASDFADRFAAYPDMEGAKVDLVAGRIGGVVIIPPDYIESGKVTAYTQGGFSGAAALDTNSLETMLVKQLLYGKVEPKIIERAAKPEQLTLITLDSKGNPTTSGPFSFLSGFLVPYILSIFLVISIFSASGYLLRSVSEEKETRVIEIILSSVSATQLLAGKVIGLGALGLTQVTVWLLSAFVLSGGLGAVVAGAIIVSNPVTFVLAAVYFLLGYLVFGIIMATAGSLGTNVRESQQLAGIFTFPAGIPYMIAGFLIANPNASIARILSFIPLTAPTMMMLRLPLGTVPTEDIIGSIVVLLVTIPIVLWAGAKIFRMGLLMYGKRPSVKEIVRALRSA
ncbi:MAG TPA: ABC transporter permease [Anaerolineae bacterium]